MVLRTLLALAVLLGPAMALDRLVLSGSWQLNNAGSPAVKLADVRLPASVLPALQRAGIVQDPLWRWAEPRTRCRPSRVCAAAAALPPPVCQALYTCAAQRVFSPPHCPCRYNERELRWVALDTWTFSLQFDAPRSLLSRTAVLLRCDGLDTVASVELNGSPVGASVNAHRPHSFDVTQLLAEGPNHLAIRFEPAAGYAAAQRDAYPYLVPHTQQVGAVPGYNFIRKAARQASFQLAWLSCCSAECGCM